MDEVSMLVIGMRICESRRKRGLTQSDVAVRLGILAETVGDWERGAQAPDAEQISQLARLFGVNGDFLLGKTANAVSADSYYQFGSNQGDGQFVRSGRSVQIEKNCPSSVVLTVFLCIIFGMYVLALIVPALWVLAGIVSAFLSVGSWICLFLCKVKRKMALGLKILLIVLICIYPAYDLVVSFMLLISPENFVIPSYVSAILFVIFSVSFLFFAENKQGLSAKSNSPYFFWVAIASLVPYLLFAAFAGESFGASIFAMIFQMLFLVSLHVCKENKKRIVVYG